MPPAPGDDPSPAATGGLAFLRIAPGVVPNEGEIATAALVFRPPEGADVTLDRRVTAGAPAAWSPDGDEVAYLDGDALAVADLDGGRRVLFRCEPPACLGLGAPAWSPDGATIAFPLVGSRGDAVWAVDAAGGEATAFAEVAASGPPAWSPDGATLAVPSGDGVALVDAGTGEVAGDLRFAGDLVGDRLAWSPDGTAVALGCRAGGEVGVFRMDVVSGDVTLLTRCRRGGCADLDPAWSPDGELIALTRAWCGVPGGDCATGDLYVVAAAGGRATPLDIGPALDCCASWQPLRP